MPTYEFRCPEGHTFDRFYRKMSDAVSELPCPECGKVASRQLSGGAGFVLKGSGFYLTDYGKNAHRREAPGTAKRDAGRGEGASESSSAESKPAAASSDSTSSEAKSGASSTGEKSASTTPSTKPAGGRDASPTSGSSGPKSEK